ncbi:MAG: DUF2938 family protein [Planctomycetota bacterium]|jgi:hypothetical protein
MELIIVAVVAGVMGTLAMDSLNYLFFRTGMLLRIDVRMIGRIVAGWPRLRFRYSHPGEIEPFAGEKIIGHLTHYAIGVGLALFFVIGWDLLFGGIASPGWALVYGVATTVNSWFIVYPSMGLGVFGKRSPERSRAVLSPLANHLFYGVGLAVGIASYMIPWIQGPL